MKQASYQQIQDEQGYLILAFRLAPPSIGAVVPKFRAEAVVDVATVVIGHATATEWIQQRDRYRPGARLPENIEQLGFAKVVAE